MLFFKTTDPKATDTTPNDPVSAYSCPTYGDTTNIESANTRSPNPDATVTHTTATNCSPTYPQAPNNGAPYAGSCDVSGRAVRYDPCGRLHLCGRSGDRQRHAVRNLWNRCVLG